VFAESTVWLRFRKRRASEDGRSSPDATKHEPRDRLADLGTAFGMPKSTSIRRNGDSHLIHHEPTRRKVLRDPNLSGFWKVPFPIAAHAL